MPLLFLPSHRPSSPPPCQPHPHPCVVLRPTTTLILSVACTALGDVWRHPNNPITKVHSHLQTASSCIAVNHDYSEHSRDSAPPSHHQPLVHSTLKAGNYVAERDCTNSGDWRDEGCGDTVCSPLRQHRKIHHDRLITTFDSAHTWDAWRCGHAGMDVAHGADIGRWTSRDIPCTWLCVVSAFR